MKKLITLLAFTIVLGLSTSAFAFYCWNAPKIMRASHRLDQQTHHFERQLYNVRGYNHLADDVRDLTRAVRHLHRLAERDSSCEHLRDDFRTVREKFQHVRHMLRRAHRTHHASHVMEDWRDVVSAYRDVQDEIYASRRGGINIWLDRLW